MVTFSLAVLCVLTFLIFFIGVIVFFGGTKDKKNQYFFGMCAALSIWMLANYYENELGLGRIFNVLCLKVDFASAVFLAYFFFIFTLRFPKSFRDGLWKIDLILLVPTAVLSVLSFTDKIVNNFTFENSSIGFGFGSLFVIYAVMVFFYFVGGTANLVYKFIRHRGIERIQILYVMVGCGIAFINGAIINLLLQNVLPVDLFRFGIYGVFFIAACTAYAIFKHHLMDIKVIATEALTFAILLILLVEALLSKGWIEFIFRQLFFVAVCFLGSFLIRSVIREVDRRKEIQLLADRLARANDQLKKLDQSKTEFISIASHQLRTPLAAIKGYISMLMEGDFGKINGKISGVLGKIYESNTHLVHLVDTLLNISRIETGRIEFSFQKTDIANFTKRIISQFDMAIKSKGMNIKLTFKNQVPQYMIFDSDKMGEVFVNLLDNAIKYGGKGDIEVTLENKDGSVEICVIDNGIGIAKEDINDLFAKFKRGVNATATEVQGSGLGLYICRKLIEAHGGRIWAESPGPGKGSKFCVSLPKDPRKALGSVRV